MKLIDEKGKIFGIVNIIDLVVLVLVVLIIGIVGYKVLGNKIGSSPQAKDIVFTVKCQGRSPLVVQELKKGDQLISNSNYVDAFVDSFTTTPAVLHVQTSDGRMVIAKDPDKLDIVVTVKMKYVGGDTIKLGSQEISAGSTFTLKTHTVQFPGTIETIN